METTADLAAMEKRVNDVMGIMVKEVQVLTALCADFLQLQIEGKLPPFAPRRVDFLFVHGKSFGLVTSGKWPVASNKEVFNSPCHLSLATIFFP